MNGPVQRAWLLFAIGSFAGGAPAARAAHGKDIDKLYAHGLQSEQKGDCWQALHDAEAVLRADPGWTDALQLRRTAGYEAHLREALRLMDAGDWARAGKQLENARVYKDTAALAAKLHLVHTRLRREETVRATGDRLEAAHEEARQALERSDFDTARERLGECLRDRPEDAGIRAELEAVDARAAAAAAAKGYLGAVTQALDAGDWKLADQRIRQQPAIPDPPPPVPHADLLGPLRLYAAGRTDEARQGARKLALRQSDPLAGPLLLFLNARLRQEQMPSALGWLGALYAAALVASLYFGLRREVRGRTA